ncbi:hypothetical protein D8M21_05795 [Kocuria sp. HSID16901]|nr:hypothetical protein D8M21_05795 [Kocuria sp. HSID16901]
MRRHPRRPIRPRMRVIRKHPISRWRPDELGLNPPGGGVGVLRAERRRRQKLLQRRPPPRWLWPSSAWPRSARRSPR